MKRIITILFAFMLSFVALYAQKDVTRFLGIPVDGSQTDMINKLKEKRFKYLENNILEGVFNGRDVLIVIGTNNDKVMRIVVVNKKTTDEIQIKRHFNLLFEQFSNNEKYIYAKGNKIDDDENLWNGIVLDKKEYFAVFYQKSKSDTNDENLSKRPVWFKVIKDYTYYNICIYYDNLYNHSNGEDL